MLQAQGRGAGGAEVGDIGFSSMALSLETSLGRKLPQLPQGTHPAPHICCGHAVLEWPDRVCCIPLSPAQPLGCSTATSPLPRVALPRFWLPCSAHVSGSCLTLSFSAHFSMLQPCPGVCRQGEDRGCQQVKGEARLPAQGGAFSILSLQNSSAFSLYLPPFFLSLSFPSCFLSLLQL